MELNLFSEGNLRKIFCLFHINLSGDTLNVMSQFIKFTIVGASSSIVAYLINILTLLILKPYNLSWDYFAGNISSFLLSVLWSFFWNSKYAFRLEDGETRNPWNALLKTYATYAFTGLVLNNVLSYIWIDMMGISKIIAPLINMVIGLPINYVLNKIWAFKTVK